MKFNLVLRSTREVIDSIDINEKKACMFGKSIVYLYTI